MKHNLSKDLKKYRVDFENPHVWIYFSSIDDLVGFESISLCSEQRYKLSRLSPNQVQNRQKVYGFLNEILKFHEGKNENDSLICYELNQKPKLHSGIGSFNLSHTKNGTLVVYSDRFEVGCDLEEANRRINEPEKMADRIFSSQEKEVLTITPSQILKTWVAKEAIAKCFGQGVLSVAQQYTVIANDHVLGPQTVSLTHLDLPEFVAAVAWV